MFYKTYIKKTDKELIEILNSDSYQLNARKTAQNILIERGVSHQIIDEKPMLNKTSVYELLEKLNDYNINIYTSQKRGIIEISENNYGFILGLGLLSFGVISFISTIIAVFVLKTEVFLLRGYLAKYGYLATVIGISGGVVLFKGDKLTKVVINLKDNELKITKRNLFKEKIEILSLLESAHFKVIKRKKDFELLIEVNKKQIELFRIKDNNIGEKTNDFLCILTEKINDKINTVGNNGSYAMRAFVGNLAE